MDWPYPIDLLEVFVTRGLSRNDRFEGLSHLLAGDPLALCRHDETVVDRQRGAVLADQPEQDALGHVCVYPLQPTASTGMEVCFDRRMSSLDRLDQAQSGAPVAICVATDVLQDLVVIRDRTTPCRR